MIYEIDERGYFWWSDNVPPDGAFAPVGGVHGSLKIGPEGDIELELDSALSQGFKSMFDPDRAQNKQICGLLKSDNRRVLLGKLIVLNSVLANHAFSHEKFGAEFCFVYHDAYAILNAIDCMSKMEINLNGFEEWFGPGSISLKSTSRSTTVFHRTKKKRSYRIENGKLSFLFGLAKPYDRSSWRHVRLTETISLIYEKKFQSLESAIEEFQIIQDFLLILTNCERTLDWPTLQLNINKIEAKLYFRRGKTLNEEIRYQKLWITFPAIHDIFPALFNNWRQKREYCGPGIYYYLGLRRGLQLFSEHRFMNSIWGLESLHRRLFGNCPDAKIQEKVKRVVVEVQNSSDRRWLARQLKFSAEPSLRDRISSLFSSLVIDLDKRRLSDFSERCARYRNDLSHFGTVRHEMSYKEFIEELHTLADALELLYHFRILQEIGVPDAYVQRLFDHGFQAYSMKKVLWDAGILAEDPKIALEKSAKISIEAANEAIKKQLMIDSKP